MRHEQPPLPATLGEMAELGRLFKENEDRLLGMLQRRISPSLTPRLDAGEILNEAFLVAQRKWGQFKDQSELTAYAWLYRISLDCLIQNWRKQTRGRRDPRREIAWPERSSMQLVLGLVNPATSPSEALAREEQRERVRQVLGLLKPGDQEILWMRHYDQLAFKEAAALLGVSESAATLRYVRALKRLRLLWEQIEGRGESHA